MKHLNNFDGNVFFLYSIFSLELNSPTKVLIFVSIFSSFKGLDS